MPVSVKPGETVLTVMPRGASSCANPFVYCSSAAFAAKIRRRTGKTQMGSIGRNVHDAATLFEYLGRFLHREVGTLGVQGDDLIEVSLGCVEKRLGHKPPGIVDENVEPAELLHRLDHEAARIGHLAHVGLDSDGFATFGLNARHDLPGLLRAVIRSSPPQLLHLRPIAPRSLVRFHWKPRSQSPLFRSTIPSACLLHDTATAEGLPTARKTSTLKWAGGFVVAVLVPAAGREGKRGRPDSPPRSSQPARSPTES